MSIILAAVSVIPANNTSPVHKNILALKPAATAAYTAAIPIKGCYPIDIKIKAAKGGKIINPESEAIFEFIPIKINAIITIFVSGQIIDGIMYGMGSGKFIII